MFYYVCRNEAPIIEAPFWLVNYSNFVDMFFISPYGFTLKRYPHPKIPTPFGFTSLTFFLQKFPLH